MVFNFKKTFTLGSKWKNRDNEDNSIICVQYIRSPEFDINYIVSTGYKNAPDVRNMTDIKWTDVFPATIPDKENTPKSENLEESIPNEKPTITISKPPKSILKKVEHTVSNETLSSENAAKSTITIISNKEYDGASDEFARKKLQVEKDETRTERRDTKAIIALKKAREEKEKLMREAEAEENHDVTYQTRMSMLYSSQASSIFFTEDETENHQEENEYEIIESPKADIDDHEPEVYEFIDVSSTETLTKQVTKPKKNKIEVIDDYEPEVYYEPEIDTKNVPKLKKKMAQVKKSKQSVKNLKMYDSDDQTNA